jgi:tetratricopeptide (TPR) repeat protein
MNTHLFQTSEPKGKTSLGVLPTLENLELIPRVFSPRKFMKFDSFGQRLIGFFFSALFFLVPLFFTPFNSELFEFNKIILVYAFTVLIVSTWVGRMILQRKIIFQKTPLDIPFLIFLISQFLSFFFSIDRHTSFWGYYSRFNGGLLSTASYLLLYWAFVSNCQTKDVQKIIKVSFVAGLIVSLYGILEHFGHSVSCLLFKGGFTVDCWVQDVQARVFATLGQPNWLAAYLAILIPVAASYLFRAKDKRGFAYYLILNTLYFSCLLFTGSRSGFLGLVTALGVLGIFIFLFHRRNFRPFLRPCLILTTNYLLLIVIFGSPFAQLNRYLPFKPKMTAATVSNGPQLEVGGTESGKIRQIVWQGAWEIFRHYPVFGTGVETFAYSYYNFRPVSHNSVSEWDFLYNKAHNEYLNYLSTTGAVGLGAYLLFIIWFVVWGFSALKKSFSPSEKLNTNYLILATFSGWLSILVSNFFGFSVVLISLYFYLIPAFVFVLGQPPTASHQSSLPLTLGRKILSLVLLLATFYLLLTTVNLWRADFFYSLGQKYAKQSQYVFAYQNLNKAINLHPKEPVFLNELSSVTANLALLAASQKEATTAGELVKMAISASDVALKISPANLNLWKNRVRVFYLLSSLDPQFSQEAINALEKAISLAPTDPKLVYNLGLLLARNGQNQEALEKVQKAIELKPDYEEVRNTLATFYEDLGQRDKAIEQLKLILQNKGADPEIEARIERLEK